MALHTDLEIYQTADRLFDLALDLQKNIPREFRIVVGQRLASECVEILLLVGRANKALNRSPARLAHIQTLAEHIEAVTLLLRGACRKKVISKTAWGRSIELTDSLGKQCSGWRNQTAGTPEPEADAPADAATGDLFSAAPAA